MNKNINCIDLQNIKAYQKIYKCPLLTDVNLMLHYNALVFLRLIILTQICCKFNACFCF